MDDPRDLRLRILLCLEIERDPTKKGHAAEMAAALRKDLEAQLAIAEMRQPMPVTRPPEKP